MIGEGSPEGGLFLCPVQQALSLAQRTSDPSTSRFQVAARFTSFEQPKGTITFLDQQQIYKKNKKNIFTKKVARLVKQLYL